MDSNSVLGRKRTRLHADAVLLDCGSLQGAVSLTHGGDAQRRLLETAFCEAFERAALLPAYAAPLADDEECPVVRIVSVNGREWEIRKHAVTTLECFQFGGEAGCVLLDAQGVHSLIDMTSSSTSDAFQLPVYSRDFQLHENGTLVRLLSERTCFNCGGPHMVADCHIPVDRSRRRQSAPPKRAFLSAECFTRGQLSNRLKRALGMIMDDDDDDDDDDDYYDDEDQVPPYYEKMREYGTPPNVVKLDTYNPPLPEGLSRYDPSLFRLFDLLPGPHSIVRTMEARVILELMDEGKLNVAACRVRAHSGGEWVPLSREFLGGFDGFEIHLSDEEDEEDVEEDEGEKEEADVQGE